jgi:hypothetical protein
MNTSSDFDTSASVRTSGSLQTVWTTSLAQEAHEVVRHLGNVLDIQSGEKVLFVPSDGALTALTLANEFNCEVTVLINPGDEPVVHPAHEHITMEAGSLDALPFGAQAFDVAIVAIPLASGLQRTAKELARVLKRSGRLGVVVLSLYHDQLGDEYSNVANLGPQATQVRPAAAYRAVLAEAGFTAFLSEDRRRALRRSAQAIYREHMLQPTAPAADALGLFATGGISMTLITAEKGV